MEQVSVNREIRTQAKTGIELLVLSNRPNTVMTT